MMNVGAARKKREGGVEGGSPLHSDRKPRFLGAASGRWMVAGTVLFVVGATLALRQGGRAAWPTVEATVQSIRVVPDTTREKPGGASHAIFRPELRYRYLGPDGQALEATAWASRWSSDAAAARAFIDDFPPGAAVTIRRDPRNGEIVQVNPRTTSLPRGLPWLAMLSGIACAVIARKSVRRQSREATGRSTP
ncbi:MAG TPA: DUF3592 domain-containing protein [Polyangia bacterium]|jgi:hypothetical protein